jgi:hypothetical protein
MLMVCLLDGKGGTITMGVECGQFDGIDVPASIRKLIDPNGINLRAVCTFDTSFCGYLDVDVDEKD